MTNDEEFDAKLVNQIYEKIKGMDIHKVLAVMTNEFVSEKVRVEARFNIAMVCVAVLLGWVVYLSVLVLRHG